MSLLRRWIDQKELKELEQEIKQIFDDFSLSLEQVLPFLLSSFKFFQRKFPRFFLKLT